MQETTFIVSPPRVQILIQSPKVTIIDSDEDKSILRENADALVNKAKSIEDKLNTPAGLKAFMVNSAEAKMIRKHFTDRMRKYITDDEIFQQLLPDFAVGCRRLTQRR